MDVVTTYTPDRVAYLAPGSQESDCTKEMSVGDQDQSQFEATQQGTEGFAPLRSVVTPVEYRPREATANEPPRSTICDRPNISWVCTPWNMSSAGCIPRLAIVPPWRIARRFFGENSSQLTYVQLRNSSCHGRTRQHTVWCFSILSSKLTRPSWAAEMCNFGESWEC